MSSGPRNRQLLMPDDVILFMWKNAGQTTNHDLVRHFRRYLGKDAEFAEKNKAILKEVTGKIGFVKRLQGRKLIELHPKLRNMDADEIVEEYFNMHTDEDQLEEQYKRSISGLGEATFMKKETETGLRILICSRSGKQARFFVSTFQG